MKVFSQDDNKVKLLSSMSFGRAFHSSCVHSGHLYVCGGKSGKASSCCEQLNIYEGEWKFVADMKISRFIFRVVSCGKFIWAFGGLGTDLQTLNSAEFYDEVADEWTLTSSMIEKRSEHAAVAFRDRIFVIGGRNDEVGVFSSAEVFDIKTRQFTALARMTTPRFRFAAAISGYKLFCFSGYHNRVWDSTNAVESFNIYTEEWKEEEEESMIDVYDAVTI